MLKGHQMGSVLISLFGARFALSLILRLYCYVTVQLRGNFSSRLKVRLVFAYLWYVIVLLTCIAT